MIDRSEVSRSLAKAIAFKNCGMEGKANAWAAQLVKQLECAGILSPNAVRLNIVAGYVDGLEVEGESMIVEGKANA